MKGGEEDDGIRHLQRTAAAPSFILLTENDFENDFLQKKRAKKDTVWYDLSTHVLPFGWQRTCDWVKKSILLVTEFFLNWFTPLWLQCQLVNKLFLLFFATCYLLHGTPRLVYSTLFVLKFSKKCSTPLSSYRNHFDCNHFTSEIMMIMP